MKLGLPTEAGVHLTGAPTIAISMRFTQCGGEPRATDRPPSWSSAPMAALPGQQDLAG